MKIRALLVILLTLACAGAYAQDGGVKGKVVSRDGRVALSNVKVVVEPLGVTVMTDNHGNFNIDQLPKGEYQLKFESPPSSRTSTWRSVSTRWSRTSIRW